MNKPVIITADSTCDLSPDLLERYQIGITPLGILLGDDARTDGVDVSPDDLYAFYQQTGQLAKTNAVSPQAYHDFFRSYTEQGKAVVHISLSSRISSTHQNAKIAAMDLEDVFVIDSLSLCTGMGMLVLQACDLRDAGRPAEEIALQMELLRERVCTTFILNKLDYLSKGGRCSSVTALGANLLGIKPCIVMNNGALEVGKKYRGKLETAYAQYIRDQLADSAHIDTKRAFLSHSGLSDSFLAQMKQVILQCAPFEEVYVTRAGCTISSHCGPDTMTVIFMRKVG